MFSLSLVHTLMYFTAASNSGGYLAVRKYYDIIQCSTVKPRFTAVFGGKETSAVNRGPR